MVVLVRPGSLPHREPARIGGLKRSRPVRRDRRSAPLYSPGLGRRNRLDQSRASHPGCRKPCGPLPTRQVVPVGRPHPARQLVPRPRSLRAVRPHRCDRDVPQVAVRSGERPVEPVGPSAWQIWSTSAASAGRCDGYARRSTRRDERGRRRRTSAPPRARSRNSYVPSDPEERAGDCAAAILWMALVSSRIWLESWSSSWSLLLFFLDGSPLLVGQDLAFLVGAVLADHHKGRQEDRLQRHDHGQQPKRVVLDSQAEPDDVQVDELHRAGEAGDLVGDAVLRLCRGCSACRSSAELNGMGSGRALTATPSLVLARRCSPGSQARRG